MLFQERGGKGGPKGGGQQFLEQRKHASFQIMHNQNLRQLILTVSSCLCALHGTPDSALDNLLLWKQHTRRVKGTVSALKNPPRVKDGDESVAGRNGRDKGLPHKRSLICAPGKSLIFFTCLPLNI